MATPLASLLLLAIEPPSVATDAPDQSNGTFTVAPGAWQLEVGVDVTTPGSGPAERDVALHVPTTLRIGLGPRVELRVFDGEPVIEEERNDRVGGDLAHGLKIRFNDPRPGTLRPTFGIQPYFATSTVRIARDIETASGGAVLLWSQPLAHWLGVDLNVGSELGFGSRADVVASFFGASMQATFADRWLPYAEIYFDAPWLRRTAFELGGDAGLIFVATRRVALDVAGRATFLAEGPDYGVIAGLAVLLVDGSRWRSRRPRRAAR